MPFVFDNPAIEAALEAEGKARGGLGKYPTARMLLAEVLRNRMPAEKRRRPPAKQPLIAASPLELGAAATLPAGQ